MSGSTKILQWKAGIIGSLVGGLVFGILMAMMGSLPMIAGLVGSNSARVGFIVHLVISFIFGVTFTIFVSWFKWNPIITGLVYGIVLWFLFPFIFMPMMMGMGQLAFKFTGDVMISLVGHLIYGLVTGVVYKIIAKQN